MNGGPLGDELDCLLHPSDAFHLLQLATNFAMLATSSNGSATGLSFAGYGPYCKKWMAPLCEGVTPTYSTGEYLDDYS